MAIEQHKSFENGDSNGLQALEESLLVSHSSDCEGCEKAVKRSESSLWMVFICTLVAVCGSFEFGSCVSFVFVCMNVIVVTLVMTCLRVILKLNCFTLMSLSLC